MKLNKLYADGHELVVQKRIGKGGEGEVFSIDNLPGFAVKAYLPNLVKERESKIRAMVDAKLSHASSTIAFPYQVVVNAKGGFVGFMMRLVENHKEIHELQTPVSRLRYFPKADYRFLVRTAINIARVFSQVHAAGCIVGDINQRGILVSPTATVALIDADSFQLTHNGSQYLCAVGVPEYTPPELQGRSLKSIVRTQDHDAFGLAVSLFQLLCMDRHPFAGRYKGSGDMPLEKAIAEYRFAYSSRSTGMAPPPGSVQLRDFPKSIAECFEQAFSPNYTGRRPPPSRWVSVLEELEASLRPCAKNRLHHYSRDASECPWCRMEAEYGRPLFVSTDFSAIHLPKGKIDPKFGLAIDLQNLLAAVNSIPAPASISVPIPAPSKTIPSQGGVNEDWSERLGNLAKRFGGVATVLVAGYLFLEKSLPGLAALIMAGVGIWIFRLAKTTPQNFSNKHRDIQENIRKRVQALQTSSPIERVLRKKAEALDAIDEFKALAASYSRIEPDYNMPRKQKQLDAHLASYSIRGANIAKLSSSDIASLASYGISTALDAAKRDVQQVYGIGPVKKANIDAWVKRIAGKFQYRQALTPEDLNNIRKIQADIISKQQGVEDKFKRLLEETRREAQAFERWRQTKDAELVRLVDDLEESQENLRARGIAVAPLGPIPPHQVPDVGRFRKGATPMPISTPHRSAQHQAPAANTGTPQCPRCSSPMRMRVARRGSRRGRPFWGCSRYPTCNGTRPY